MPRLRPTALLLSLVLLLLGPAAAPMPTAQAHERPAAGSGVDVDVDVLGASGCAGWSRAWNASASDALAAPVPLRQSYRTLLHLSAAGRTVRLTLSNRLGRTPATIGALRIARPAGSGARQRGAGMPVTFEGRPDVVLAAGGEAVSDPLPLRVRAGSDLVVSMYVSSALTPPTQHVLAAQTLYATAPGTGDHTADPDGAAYLLATPVAGLPVAVPQGIPFLAGLDVAGGARGTVVTFGDSITDGFQSSVLPVVPSPATIDRNGRYPDFLARRLARSDTTAGWAVANAGISGNELLADAVVPIFGPSGLGRLQHDALDVPGVRTVVLLEGINDLGQGFATAEGLIAGYREVVRRAHAAGVRVVLGTLTPDAGTLQPGYGAAAEPARQRINAWIRRQHVADGVADFDRAVRDPSQPDRLLPAYDGGDHLHLSRAGYRAMAAAVPLADLGTAPRC